MTTMIQLRRMRRLLATTRKGYRRMRRIGSRTYGGRSYVQNYHQIMRDLGAPGSRYHSGRTQTMTTNPQAKPRTPTVEPNPKSRALILPEGKAVARAAAAIEDWIPAGAVEVHEMLVTLATATSMFGTAILAVAETLAVKGADGARIVNPIIGCAEAVGGAAHQFQAVDRMFLHLYAGDIEQDQSPATPMVYAEPRR